MKSNGLLTAILQNIQRADRILVYRHTNPDPDAIGSQLGLVQLLKTAFPSKQVLPVGVVPGHLTWIGVGAPELVTPQTGDLVITVDCANHGRLAGNLPDDAFIIKIDHHPNRDPYGQLNWVDDRYSSCAEMVYDLFAAHPAELTMTTSIAAKLYAGILGDTVRFSTPETSAKTLATAAELAAYGIDIATISHHEMDLTPKLSKLYGYVLSHLNVDALGLAHVTLSQTVLRTLGVPYDETDAIVPLPGNLTNVKVWLIFVATPQGTYRVHFRSKHLPVDGVAKAFNGGGHALASGAFVADAGVVADVIATMQTELKKQL
ncbi:bifunctional oligoribonuclease/PAP phosphatase NrnA [Lactiplantibacillus garii]|uniref:Bifunctional oligoribonuclease/PAP phosphatase NrnA n=1 Tax=Lactiplantibacillus garii TaxID=2306423 RepID=A0A3R8J7C8_9LACO|nr:bifunctional oligoribonuclease/PAP phosphatase NrnA [Lactiplantibacillus garii]RRK10464.1 bifunctional oligoribonuclease/PAP phosphatase NrnA [Lactiplantibacillus garii]